MSGLVTFEIRDSVAVVTLNDSARMNPLSNELQRELAGAISKVEGDTGIRAMLLTGAGRGFCAGADLKEFAQKAQSLSTGEALGGYIGRMMEERVNPLISRLRNLPVPVVCGVNGAAARCRPQTNSC